jgi:hypothetical protein
MRNKIISVVFIAAIAVAAAWNFSQSSNAGVELSDIALANVEALAADEESDSKPKWCTNGCSAIGWGTEKILECDCNYDHASKCNRWGC